MCSVVGQERGLRAGWQAWMTEQDHWGEHVPGQWLGDLQSQEDPGPTACRQLLTAPHAHCRWSEPYSFCSPWTEWGCLWGWGHLYPGEIGG